MTYKINDIIYQYVELRDLEVLFNKICESESYLTSEEYAKKYALEESLDKEEENEI